MATVRSELEEYIATDAIEDHFVTVYKAVAEAKTEPHEGIGVWVSGFFGSGKSSFAKILGYTVAARDVGGQSASELFKEIFADPRLKKYRFKDLKAIKLSLSVDGEIVESDGDVRLNILCADSREEETTRDFVCPPPWPDGRERVASRHAELAEIEAEIDEEVYRLYGISEEDRAGIEAELAEGTALTPDPSPETGEGSEDETGQAGDEPT